MHRRKHESSKLSIHGISTSKNEIAIGKIPSYENLSTSVRPPLKLGYLDTDLLRFNGYLILRSDSDKFKTTNRASWRQAEALIAPRRTLILNL